MLIFLTTTIHNNDNILYFFVLARVYYCVEGSQRQTFAADALCRVDARRATLRSIPLARAIGGAVRSNRCNVERLEAVVGERRRNNQERVVVARLCDVRGERARRRVAAAHRIVSIRACQWRHIGSCFGSLFW
jgi:hypothetical protein